VIGLPYGAGGPCNCTPGVLCVPPNGYHRAECPVVQAASQLMSAPPTLVTTPGVDENGKSVLTVSTRQALLDATMRQSWIEITRPLVAIGTGPMPTYEESPGDIKLRAENETLRREVEQLRAENAELREEVFRNRFDKRLQASMKDEIAKLRQQIPVDQRPGIPTPCAACDGRRVVPSTDKVGRLFTKPCPACTPDLRSFEDKIAANSPKFGPTWEDLAASVPKMPPARRAAVRQEVPLPDTAVRVVDMDEDE
jgi:hypothetical protein